MNWQMGRRHSELVPDTSLSIRFVLILLGHACMTDIVISAVTCRLYFRLATRTSGNRHLANMYFRVAGHLISKLQVTTATRQDTYIRKR
ncbi:hypothetical protein GGR50DRAFT_640592 [Xylaria sp. CBS 124048]|nr:hypothetical protein GGR50DRAFT_640592 [Xylaria sp. CBS 124048]